MLKESFLLSFYAVLVCHSGVFWSQNVEFSKRVLLAHAYNPSSRASLELLAEDRFSWPETTTSLGHACLGRGRRARFLSPLEQVFFQCFHSPCLQSGLGSAPSGPFDWLLCLNLSGRLVIFPPESFLVEGSFSLLGRFSNPQCISVATDG